MPAGLAIGNGTHHETSKKQSVKGLPRKMGQEDRSSSLSFPYHPDAMPGNL
jgi:hypothetical protein